MKFYRVEAATVIEIGYQADIERLRVVTATGKCIEYSGVPSWVAGQMMFADAPGRYYAAKVLGQYQSKIVERNSDPVIEEPGTFFESPVTDHFK